MPDWKGLEGANDAKRRRDSWGVSPSSSTPALPATPRSVRVPSWRDKAFEGEKNYMQSIGRHQGWDKPARSKSPTTPRSMSKR